MVGLFGNAGVAVHRAQRLGFHVDPSQWNGSGGMSHAPGLLQGWWGIHGFDPGQGRCG